MHKEKIAGIHFAAGRWPRGDTGPTLVFIHGSGGTHGLWKGQVDALAARVNTVAIDLPGHGASDGGGMRQVSDYAGAVAGFIETPDPSPCGLSLGGAIVQQLLIDRPDICRGGILAGSGARLKVLPAIFEAIESDYEGFLDMLDKLAFSPATAEAVKQPIIEDSANCPPGVTFGDFEACNRFDAMGRIDQIQLPVLVVTAEDDKLTPPKYGDFLEKAIPRAFRAHIQNAGHHMPAERPDEFNRAVADFLDAIRQ